MSKKTKINQPPKPEPIKLGTSRRTYATAYANQPPTKPMDLLKACDELKAVVHTAQTLVDAWEEDPDNYSVLEEHLKELAIEVRRIQGEEVK